MKQRLQQLLCHASECRHPARRVCAAGIALRNWMPAFAGMTGVLLLLSTTPALAEVSVTPALVRSGFFLAPDCTPTADPKAYNECVCEANIKKPQIAGVAPEVMSAINAELSILPEKLAAESCEGTPTTSPAVGIKVNQAQADYEVAYQTATTLTVLAKYSTYGAGSDHALEGTEGFTFDLTSGKRVDPVSYLKPEELKKADAAIKAELLKKYPTELFEEAKTRKEAYLNENGCDTCTLFYGKSGWMVRFQIESIAPFAIGEPEIALPADVIAPPEKLIVKS